MNSLVILMVIIAIILIAVILLQQKSSSLGSMAGQEAGEEMAQTRRGPEKFLHQLTIFLVILFMMIGLYSMFFGEKPTPEAPEISIAEPTITLNEGNDTEAIITPETETETPNNPEPITESAADPQTTEIPPTR